MQNLKEWLLFYTQHLYTIDFLFLFLVIFVFMCILLVVAFLGRHPILALLVLIFDFVACGYLFYYGYDFIDSRVRAREAEIMAFRYYGGNNLSVDFNITNLSRQDFFYCEVTAKLRPKLDENASFFITYKNHFFPLRSKSRNLERGLLRGETQMQRINFENFGDKNITMQLTSECF